MPKRTSIELKLAKLLTKLGLEFEEQKRMPKQKTIPDFYLPEHKLVLYADGDYWHRTPRRQYCDKRINHRLEKAGYTVLRFWETDINHNLPAVELKIKQATAMTHD